MMLIDLPLPFTEKQAASNLSDLAAMPQDDEWVKSETEVQKKYLKSIKKSVVKNG